MFYAGREQFRTFQELVSLSEPGTTLHLPEGLVELGRGVVVRRGLRLKGCGMGRTILHGDVVCLILRGAEGDTWLLEDLTLENASSDHFAVSVGGRGELRLERCEVRSTVLALSAADDVRVSVDSCRIHGEQFGIQGKDRAVLQITNTELSGCKHGALWIEDESSCHVAGSRFHRNHTGAILSSSADCQIAGCKFTENQAAGVVVEGASQARLLHNLCRGSLGRGIVLQGLSRASVRGNLCEDNAIGIEVADGAEPMLLENRLLRNRLCGLRYLGSASGTAQSTHCDRNSTCGIQVEEDASPVLRANRCTGSEMGIRISGHARAEVVENDCNANDYGLLLEGGDCLVEGNDCRHNVHLGIGGMIGRGTIRRNRLAGNRLPLYLSFESRHRVEDGVAFVAAERLPERRAEVPSTRGLDLDELQSDLAGVHRDRLLATQGDSKAPGRLVGRLNHLSRSIRAEAAQALGSLGSSVPHAVPALVAMAVADLHEEVRGAALRALVSLCPDLQEAPFWTVSGDRHERLLAGALMAVDFCGFGRGTWNWVVLYQFATLPNPVVRRHAAQALADDYFATMRREAPEDFSALFADLARLRPVGRSLTSTVLACMDPDRLAFHLDAVLRQGTEGDALPALAVLEHYAPERSEALDLLFRCLDRAALTAEAIAALSRLGC